MTLTKITLKAGTTVYHGTDSYEFDEENDALEGPAWVTSSREAAEHFASRSNGWGGEKRIVEFKLAEDIALFAVYSANDLTALSDAFGIDTRGVDNMRESVEASSIPGWIVPNNYRPGDDIMLRDTSALDFVASHPLPKKKPGAQP